MRPRTIIQTVVVFFAGFFCGGVILVGATPFPTPQAQLDLNGDCVINFPGDGLEAVKYSLGVKPIPTGFPTCRDWYATATPTP